MDTNANNANNANNAAAIQDPHWSLEVKQIYVKELSLESPSAESFQDKPFDTAPTLTVDLEQTHHPIATHPHHYEVVIRVTVTVKHGDKTILVIEVYQVGIFAITGDLAAELLEWVLSVQCAAILFPYVRTTVSDLSMRRGFPPIYLLPVNFDTIYRQRLNKDNKDRE